MEFLASKNIKFSNFSNARYATGVTFQMANRPAENISENKKTLSENITIMDLKQKFHFNQMESQLI